jgi:cysteinyl-tRNA synthetase
MRFDAMDLKLYDTLTREKRVFAPLDPANVRMYVCGPTVYDFAHIGNARPVIVFDVLFRLLRHIYGEKHVTYVRNITDVDDKINARAAEEYPDLPLNEAIRKVTEKTDRQFHEDVAALGCLPPTVEPRATEHIAEMRTLIDRLVASGNAYVAEEHVLFYVPSMREYGKLSKRTLEEMIEGARVEVAPYKRDPMDFVLWKPSKPGEPAWPSPAGITTPGRPGWHIECSAMSWKHLGETFDIHGGGIDLVFPHHENEIAQSRCAFHTPAMANYWMHNGFLQVEGEKMSKSLGNFETIRDLLQNWPGDVLRLNMLHTHYRHPIDWTREGLITALKELQLWTELISLHLGEGAEMFATHGEIDSGVVEALMDDLNTPLAISHIHKLFELAKNDDSKVVDLLGTLSALGFKHLNKPGLFHQGFAANLFESGPQIGPEEMRQIQLYRTGVANNFPAVVSSSTRNLETAGFIVKMNDAGVLFIGNKTSAEMANNSDPESLLRAKVDNLIAMRSAARQAKDFVESDRIRDELAKMGVELEDRKGEPTTWKFKKAAS